MKSPVRRALLTIVLPFLLSGCLLTREPIRYHEEFFRPIVAMPQRNHPASSSAEFDQMKNQLESATKAAIIVRDSLASLQKIAGLMLAPTNSHIDKVNKLESKEILIATKETDLEHNIEELQSENKKLSQQLAEVHAQLRTSYANAELSVYTPAGASSSLKNEYAEGLSFFRQRQYSKALKIFKSLLDKGIEEDFADHCEYWMGECYFAKREYLDAITHFQKVLSITSSNKKVDAYFMLDKTYERIGDIEKARIAYKELNVKYPNNGHAKIVKSRLGALTHTLHANTQLPINEDNPVTLPSSDRSSSGQLELSI